LVNYQMFNYSILLLNLPTLFPKILQISSHSA
jgi:hypothetical protein